MHIQNKLVAILSESINTVILHKYSQYPITKNIESQTCTSWLLFVINAQHDLFWVLGEVTYW